MLSAAAGYAAGENLRSLGDELSQAKRILVVNVVDLICAEGANLSAAARIVLGRKGALRTLCGSGSSRSFSSFNCCGFNSVLGIQPSETSSCDFRTQNGRSSSSAISSNFGAEPAFVNDGAP